MIRVHAQPQRLASKSTSLEAAFLVVKRIMSRVVKVAWHQNDLAEKRTEPGGALVTEL